MTEALGFPSAPSLLLAVMDLPEGQLVHLLTDYEFEEMAPRDVKVATLANAIQTLEDEALARWGIRRDEIEAARAAPVERGDVHTIEATRLDRIEFP